MEAPAAQHNDVNSYEADCLAVRVGKGGEKVVCDNHQTFSGSWLHTSCVKPGEQTCGSMSCVGK